MIFNIIMCLVGIFIIVDGIYALVNGKNIGGSSEKTLAKFTPESYKRFSRITGIFEIIIGIVLLLYDVQHYFFAMLFGGVDLALISWIIIGVCVVIIIILYFTVPKKRVAGVDYGDAPSKDKDNDDDQYIDED